jgi:hypothetical protein
MTINIEVTGMGGEMVMGTFTPQDHKTIKEYMERNGIEELEDFYGSDLFPNYENEELDILPWNEVDDLVHTYGPNDECDIRFTDEDGEVLYEGSLGYLSDDTELYNSVDEEIIVDKPNNLFFASYYEEGTWGLEFEIECDGFDEFDITKFGIRERNITTPNGNGVVVYDNMTYDGVDLETLEGMGGDIHPLRVSIE